MKNHLKNSAKKANKSLIASGAALSLSALMAMSTSAHAEPTGYNQLTFNTEVKSEVANDEVRATLYKKAQATDAKTLAKTLNTAVNSAVAIAKRYPSVTVKTGQQNTYPRYDKNDKIIGWTGQANIELKSTDFTATSQLIADLQETLVMDNLSFGVSEPKKDELERQLMVQASRAFQDQAKTMTSAWDAKGYRVINVNLNTGNNYPRPMYGAMMKTESMSDSVPAQNFESGNSTITVTANGTIELVK
jgi:predicted secreted protein